LSAEDTEIVLPYQDNALRRRLEENRLANDLAVVDWQDRMAA